MKDTTKELNQILSAVTRGDKIHAMAGKVLQLQTADKFRLAGELLAFGHVEIAETIAQRAIDEIALARVLGKPKAEVGR